jgi:hypothetical protein
MMARAISIALHPFVMTGVLVGTAAAARQTPVEATRTVAVVALFTVAPLAILMTRQVTRGAWQHADASNRAERPILYGVGGAALGALIVYLMTRRPESFLIRGSLVTFGMLAVCAAATVWVKVSLHMAFATLTASALTLARSPVGYLIAALLPALIWSRLTLRRHSAPEVALGAAIGCAAGAVIHFL